MILACNQADITTTMRLRATSGIASKGMYVKADFVYAVDPDVFACRSGKDVTELMRPRSAVSESGITGSPNAGPFHRGPTARPATNGGFHAGSVKIWSTRWKAVWVATRAGLPIAGAR